MLHDPSWMAITIFGAIVAFTLGLSFWLGSKAQSAEGFFAASGGIHWFVNGVAFAGDYLSAASFLGICGMIAFYGYDGFLYSIGYLAGWIVALFVIAEPLKRMGKYTFADALDSKFQSRSIKLAAAISTLAVSIFYLIPQMVGAGVLVTPLLGLPHYAGVLMVGAVVIFIVVTAGMVSTTYVQFIKGSLLVIFSTVLTVIILGRGFSTEPQPYEEPTHQFQIVGPLTTETIDNWKLKLSEHKELTEEILTKQKDGKTIYRYHKLTNNSTKAVSYWKEFQNEEQEIFIAETQYKYKDKNDIVFVNGKPQGKKEGEAD
ncbi:Acetate permease ActP (cation/acetate symporter), partial [hydrothermal vent metagenome]